MKKLYIIFTIVASGLSVNAQQDPQYSLYQFNQMVINPAYAGARDGLAIVASVRNQWSGFDGAPRTQCMSAHTPLLNNKLGVGLTLVNDLMGPRAVTGIYGNAAYILKLGDKYKLSFGINGGYNSYRFDFSKLTYKTPETNTQIQQNQKEGVLDINAGTYLRSKSFFVGLSATHINDPTVYNYTNNSTQALNYRLRTHLFLTMGKYFVLSDNALFAPTLMIKTVNGTATGDINLNFFLMKKCWVGVYFRGGYGPGFLLQYYITSSLRAGYSFDSGITNVRKLGAGHEIMIGFDLKENKNKIVSPRFL